MAGKVNRQSLFQTVPNALERSLGRYKQGAAAPILDAQDELREQNEMKKRQALFKNRSDLELSLRFLSEVGERLFQRSLHFIEISVPHRSCAGDDPDDHGCAGSNWNRP